MDADYCMRCVECTLTDLCFACLYALLRSCSRTFINDTPVAFDPERAMAELVLHTHYLPRHWRGRAHSAEVQQSVNSMFTLKVR
jgi:autophagy-related protein 9